MSMPSANIDGVNLGLLQYRLLHGEISRSVFLKKAVGFGLSAMAADEMADKSLNRYQPGEAEEMRNGVPDHRKYSTPCFLIDERLAEILNGDSNRLIAQKEHVVMAD